MNAAKAKFAKLLKGARNMENPCVRMTPKRLAFLVFYYIFLYIVIAAIFAVCFMVWISRLPGHNDTVKVLGFDTSIAKPAANGLIKSKLLFRENTIDSRILFINKSYGDSEKHWGHVIPGTDHKVTIYCNRSIVSLNPAESCMTPACLQHVITSNNSKEVTLKSGYPAPFSFVLTQPGTATNFTPDTCRIESQTLDLKNFCKDCTTIEVS